MTTVIRDAEKQELRQETVVIEGRLNDLLRPPSSAIGDEEPANEIIAELEERIRRLNERLPYGLSGDDGRQMLLQMFNLREAIAEEDDTVIEGGGAELEALKALEIIRRMERQLDQAAFEDPDASATFVFESTQSWTASKLAELLGVTSKTVGTWKNGGPVKQNAARVQLAALLIYFLRAGHTELGMQFWFNNPAHQLGDRTPLEIMNKQGERAEVQLIAYARGGRAQLG
jgi:hypothetical protein